MKRDKNLYPLSHQHHNGLMAVLLLKKGISKQADVKVMADFILTAWKEELEEHFIAEEKVLEPSLLHLPQVQELYNRMLNEHQQIRSVIPELQQGKESTALIELFHVLLDKHIRFEERVLFPFVEEHTAKEFLNKAGERLSNLPNGNCSNYPVKFWE